MSLDRRFQILLDEARYQRLEAAARKRKTSVAAVIRAAIDETLAADLEKKRIAWADIEAAESMPVPDTVDELKAEIREARDQPL